MKIDISQIVLFDEQSISSPWICKGVSATVKWPIHPFISKGTDMKGLYCHCKVADTPFHIQGDGISVADPEGGGVMWILIHLLQLPKHRI